MILHVNNTIMGNKIQSSKEINAIAWRFFKMKTRKIRKRTTNLNLYNGKAKVKS